MASSGKLLTTCIRSARITHNYAVMKTAIVQKRLAEAPPLDACQHFGATDAAALHGICEHPLGQSEGLRAIHDHPLLQSHRIFSPPHWPSDRLTSKTPPV